MRMPGTLLTIWFVSPCPMKPAPIMPTRIGFPCSSRALSARSTMIMTASARAGCSLRSPAAHSALHLRLDLVEPLPALVFGRNFRHRERPLEAEPRVVVEETALTLWSVELSHLVASLGVVL